MSLQVPLLLLAAVGVLATTQSGNSQAAIDHGSKGDSSVTAPAELVPVSAENLRFSRLLKDTANVLQFSSISNDAPPIWGIARDDKKEAKQFKFAKKNSSAGPNFGRRALDYDEQIQAFEETTSESRIIANPYPGNEYVFVHPGRLIEAAADSDTSASVTTINNKPPRVPLALLRQKKGKRVNISPLFTEVPQVSRDAPDAKEFVWVDQPTAEHVFVGVNRQGRKHEDEDESTTNPAFQEEDLVEATTLAEDTPIETTTAKQNKKSKLIVNVVTSAPRFSVESSVGERKVKPNRPRTKSSTTTASTTTTSEASTEPSTPTTTSNPSSTTVQAPTTVETPVLSSTQGNFALDEKENLVADASHRSGTSFHGFEDSQARLQTAESQQPARVNVRPAQNGKEYEYEYIYYYYDDDEAENGEKNGEHPKKAGGHAKDAKSASSSAAASSAPSTPAVGLDDPSSVTVAITSSSTTSTTTQAPDLTSDADFEYEDDGAVEEEIKANSKAPELQKSTPTATRTLSTDEPIHKGVSSAEKISNSNPINQLDRSRGPKILPGKFDESIADYKLETEASQEEEVVQSQALSRGQPQLVQQTTSSEEDGQTAESPAPFTQTTNREPSTSAPGASTSGFDIDNMSTLAKAHKDSVNVPIVLKQSSLLKAVPVSQLQPHQVQLAEEQPSTASLTTPTTTTTNADATSEAVSPGRPSHPRLRGHRLRGNVTPRPSTTQAVTSEQAAEEKPQQSVRRPPSSRRIPSRRPPQEASENTPEQQPSASPIIETHARPLPIRPRFPPRTGGHQATTAATPIEVTGVSDAPVVPVTVSAAELNTLDDKKVKDAHIRAKSANDLFAFARLQQAISSRAPNRVQPKLVAGFVNSAEVTTDAITSSEVTTVSSFGGQSGETLGAASVEPTSTTTSTTTTEAVQVDKFGRQRGGPRFGGRTRKPLGGGSGTGSTTTTETPATTRGRFSGRRRTSTTESPEGASQQTSAAVNNNEAPKPRIPARNRFASRNRASTTESTPTAEQQKTTENEKPVQPRRRPGTFQGRRRPNQIQGQTESPVTQEETASTASSDSASTSAVTTTAAPAAPGRSRFNFAASGGRPRPAAANAPGNNPVRIRGGGRLRGPTTTTTTEATPAETNVDPAQQEQPADAEQSQSIQSENLEQPLQSSPSPDSVAPPRGSGGVLGRLKNRPKLVVTTTTVAPEGSASDKKASRLNGILNRRKNLGHLNSAVHVKEEVKESTSEVAEEANNHAHEQDDDHKGVVVQVSSSVTESEEVNEPHAGEVVEPPSTTPGSILNRLKSQRKPGSLFRKKPDPHGE